MTEFLRNHAGPKGAVASRWLVALALGLLLALPAGCGEEDRLAGIRAQHEAGQYLESLDPLRALVEEKRNDPELNYLYGLTLTRLGRLSEAMWPLRKATRDPEWAIEAGILLAGALHESRNFGEAIEAANAVLALEPENLEARLLRGRAHFGDRNEAAAFADFEFVLEKDPRNADAKVARIQALIDLDRLDEAHEAMEAAQAEFATRNDVAAKTETRLCAARFMFARERGQAEVAAAILDECLENFPKSVFVLSEAIQHFDQVGQPERATDILRRAHEAAPESPIFRTQLSNRLTRMGQVEEGLELVLKPAEEMPSFANLSALADHYLLVGDYAEAAATLEKIIAGLDEPPPSLLFMHADLLLEQRLLERAREEAAALETPFRELLEGKALLVERKPAEALATLEAGLKFWPNSAMGRYLAARAAAQLGDFERAVAEYRDAIRADAGATEAGIQLALLYEAHGDLSSAMMSVQHYANAQPNDPDAMEIIARLTLAANSEKLYQGTMAHLLRLPGQAARTVALRASHLPAGSSPDERAAVIERSGLDIEKPGHWKALAAWVEYRCEAGRAEEALARVDEAIAAYPKAPPFHEIRANALRASGAPAEAVLASLERANELDPERITALVARGKLHAERGEIAEALTLFDRASALDRSDPAAAWAAIETLLQLPEGADERADEIDERLETLLLDDPLHAEAAVLRGLRILEQGGDLDRALQLARRGLRFRYFPQSLDAIARIQLARNSPADAITALTDAEKFDAGSPTRQYWLGRAKLAAGDVEGARAAFARALQSDDFPERAAARSELASLRGE